MRRIAFAAALLIALAISGLAHSQTLRAGGTGSSPPWDFVAAGTSTPQGIVVDLLNAVAADAGFAVEYAPAIAFAELIPALNASAIDIIGTLIAITPERAQQVAFTMPYAASGDALVARKADMAEYRTFEDLRGLALGAVRGTNYGTVLTNNAALFQEVKTFDNNASLMHAVVAGEIQAAMLNAGVAGYRLAQGEFPELKLVTSWQPVLVNRPAFAMRQSEGELVARINASLSKWMGDGTISMIFARYGVDWAQP